MTLRQRIDRLEGSRPTPAQSLDLELNLAPDLAQRVQDAKAADTFPASLPTPDLRAILDAARAVGGCDG